MKMKLPIAVAFVALLATSVSTPAQDLTIAADQRYVILEILKVSTLVQEMNEVGRQGFRLKMSAVNDARVTALMERSTPPDVFEYRIVSTFSSKTGDKEVNASAAEGFRVVPHTFMVKKGLTIFNIDNVVIMEKVSKRTRTFEYKTIGAIKTSNLDKELKIALSEGWQVLDMVYGQILLERTKA